MVGDIWSKAKQFIGIDEEGEITTGNNGSENNFNPVRIKPPRRNPVEADYEVVIYEPKVYEDSLSISAKLREGNPVIINLKHLDSEEGTRLIDFVCGAAYAIDGHMMRIGESIFLFTPSTIQITNIEEKASLQQELQSAEKGNFFSK